LLNLWYPGSFPPEERFKIDKPEFPDGLWSAEIAAAYIGVHPDTLRKWVRLGKIPRVPFREPVKTFVFAGSRWTTGQKGESIDKRPVFALILEFTWRS
jgi:hypothetical protein